MVDLSVFETFGITDQEPGFYASKALLRDAFPTADLIELAESAVTVVIGCVIIKYFF